MSELGMAVGGRALLGNQLVPHPVVLSAPGHVPSQREAAFPSVDALHPALAQDFSNFVRCHASPADTMKLLDPESHVCSFNPTVRACLLAFYAERNNVASPART